MVAAAVGTDTAGSVRVPAALCGVCGLRPRHGLLAMAGVVPLAPSFDTVGPITRRARDLPLMLQALGGGQIPPLRPCAPRLGVLSSDALGEVDPEIAAIVDAAVGALRDDGAEVVAVTGPRFDLSPRTRATRLLSEAVEGHRAAKWFPDRVEHYGPQLRFHLAYASGLTPRDIATADRELARFTGSLRTALRSLDVLALPSVPVAPPALAAAVAAEKIEGPDRTTPQITRLVAPLGFAGVAAVTVPCGTASSGCPVGLQLAGEDEGRVLAVAERYELIRG
jgi:aspartyl-tRNA(Asn)/glutamyl-tRNA(Gln) amidotransferase subunit A